MGEGRVEGGGRGCVVVTDGVVEKDGVTKLNESEGINEEGKDKEEEEVEGSEGSEGVVVVVLAAALRVEEDGDEVDEIGVNVEEEEGDEEEGDEEEVGQLNNHNKDDRKSICILSSPSSPALTHASLSTHSV